MPRPSLLRRCVVLAAAFAVLVVGAGGCATMGIVNGARPLEPKQNAMGVGLSLERGTNSVNTALGIPLPQVQAAWRHGVREDFDFGIGIYLFGLQADARYRFWHNERLHLAFDPGLKGIVLPIPSTGLGSIDVSLPLLAEVTLGPTWSVTGAAKVQSHQLFGWIDDASVGTGSGSRFDLLAGGGLRVGASLRRTNLGGWVEVLANTTRRGSPWYSAGTDLTLKFGKKKAEKAADGAAVGAVEQPGAVQPAP